MTTKCTIKIFKNLHSVKNNLLAKQLDSLIHREIIKLMTRHHLLTMLTKIIKLQNHFNLVILHRRINLLEVKNQREIKLKVTIFQVGI